ncbi:MAG: 16S rRNA (guanine(527)-N(7))-methyltransferase RsmG [Phycisphaerae bacterium]|nr:16S rRNA (guanine(527)-N(7))-methyltransferase RsmG [Phycisphaerae bacterium]
MSHTDEQLSHYLALLIEANRTMNLTRIVDPEVARVQHIADALTLLPHLPPDAFDLADVGSGGGVPGMVLAIVRPDARVVLLESTTKKAEFLKQTASALQLKNVSVEAIRAEAAGSGSRRESFDIVTSRAVGEMVWVAEWCLPLVRVGGTLLAMKGPRVNEELPIAKNAIGWLGGGEATVIPAPLPGAEGHVIVTIPKLRRTDRRLPRPPERAKGKPLTRL